MRPAAQTAVLLVVEDNRADARLVEEAFKEMNTPVLLSQAEDGEEAMNVLRRVGGHSDAPRPNLILLDLNLPRKDGREVLAEVKADPDLRRIPVVIMTSSQDPDDVYKCYDLGANCYVAKALEYDEFFRRMRSLAGFWLTVATLPGR